MNTDRPWAYLDDMKRDELPNWTKDVADTLDDWLFRMHGVMSGGHHVGVFLNLLERNGLSIQPRSGGSCDPGATPEETR